MYSELKKRIQGPVFSVVTPFLPDDRVDFESLGNYLTYAHRAGARIFYVMGYNSRFSELSWQEIHELNGFVTNTIKGIDTESLVIVADPLHCSTAVSIEFAQEAESIGADIISMIFREKYYSDKQVVTHYEKIASQSSTPLLVHEMPFLSGFDGKNFDWPISLLGEVLAIESVVALKEDAKNDELTREIAHRFRDQCSIIVSGGGKKRWRTFEKDGITSWLNGIGVFEPGLAVRFWQAVKEQDTAKMDLIINKVEAPFFDACVAKYGWHLAAKAALQARGHMKRHERLPMLALETNQYDHVASVINSLPIEEALR